MPRIASIDLGTNTCNLLVADVSNIDFTRLVSERRVVKLLDNKLKKNVIDEAAIQRCINAFIDYKNIINKYNVKHIVAFATSGLRNAENNKEITKRIFDTSGITIEIIDGDREAQMIFSGVSKVVNTIDEPLLLLDIGGGSNEFIAYNNDEILYANSFEIGIARLLNTYKFSDPLSEKDIKFAIKLFDQTLNPLIDFSKSHKYGALVGSSGTFETLASIYKYMGGDTFPNEPRFIIPMESFNAIFKNIIKSNRTERANIEGMDLMRIEMIPLASLLVYYVINKFNIEMIIYSRYSLKEGAIFDYYNKNFKI